PGTVCVMTYQRASAEQFLGNLHRRGVRTVLIGRKLHLDPADRWTAADGTRLLDCKGDVLCLLRELARRPPLPPTDVSREDLRRWLLAEAVQRLREPAVKVRLADAGVTPVTRWSEFLTTATTSQLREAVRATCRLQDALDRGSLLAHGFRADFCR